MYEFGNVFHVVTGLERLRTAQKWIRRSFSYPILFCVAREVKGLAPSCTNCHDYFTQGSSCLLLTILSNSSLKLILSSCNPPVIYC